MKGAMEEVIQIGDKWYAASGIARADDRTLVLKAGESFAVFDRYGDIIPVGLGELGIYHEGTRYLSLFEISVEQRRPLLLHSTVTKDNVLLTVDLTTPDLMIDGDVRVAKDRIHIARSRILEEGVCYERIRIQNYDTHPHRLNLAFQAETDGADIFEVRGNKREQRGSIHPPRAEDNALILAYTGLDGVTRRTRIQCSGPCQIAGNTMAYSFHLIPGEPQQVDIAIICNKDDVAPEVRSFDAALETSLAALQHTQEGSARIASSNEGLNEWITRSRSDLAMLTTNTPWGRYPYAGVPWFSTPFGRDAILTAVQALWYDPGLARGTLRFLAHHQAKEHNPRRDAEPGKILHEMRRGEMAALGEVPFDCYYGTIDATPLFLVLAGAYYERTADVDLIRELWPGFLLALEWIDRYGDADGDGFIEYERKGPQGLLTHGWKDSNDSVCHGDGRLAHTPIAFCEVQGYAYHAKTAMALLGEALGDAELAARLRHEAAMLRARFNEAFWIDEMDTYGMALDGDKHLCRVQSSNAGHLLWSGIVPEDRAQRLAKRLFENDNFSGWGIRTLGAGERRYNPMSYHNGSIWPHDNAIIAMGLARHGFKDDVIRLLTGLYEASVHLDLYRLPELFCGFPLLPGQGPTRYPVACSPQAWACAAVFALIQAALGMRFSASAPQLIFCQPKLPPYIRSLNIENLQLPGGAVDLTLQRHAKDVGINVTRKEGDVDIAIYV